MNPIHGFRHHFANSKFWLGKSSPAVQANVSEQRFIGDEGVFAEFDNGFSMGVPHATATSITAGPLSQDPANHTTRVLQYFQQAGLPKEQLGGTAINTLIRKGGTADGAETSRTLIGFTTIIKRALFGVPVVDSHAYAMFNKDDNVIEEAVWWPELPSSLGSDVTTLQATLASPSAEAAFRAKLPASLAEAPAMVVIHHAQPIGKAWYNVATIDIQTEYEVRSFDGAGVEVVFGGPAPASDPK